MTAGLKRVTDDMKTKNRADRSGVVPVIATARGAAAGGAGTGRTAARQGPPRFELEAGRKWVVENQMGNRDIVITDTDPKQTVYIYGCTECTIQARRDLMLAFNLSTIPDTSKPAHRFQACHLCYTWAPALTIMESRCTA